MNRLTAPFMLVVLGLAAALLASAIAVEFYVFRQDRLQQLEQVNSGLGREFARIIERQLEQAMELKDASRVLSRVAGLETRPELISLMAVTDLHGERVYYFDDHPHGSYDAPSLSHAEILREWQALASAQGPDSGFWSRRDPDMLYVATPISGPEGRLCGVLVIGLADPVPLMDFLLATHSPLVAASALMYLAAVIALLIIHFTKKKLLPMSEMTQAIDSDTGRARSALDLAIDHVEQAIAQLDKVAK